MTTPREWRVCKHHPEVNPETMWGCPDCLAELRHELAQAIENEGRALKTVDEQADEIGALRLALEEALTAWEGFGKTARMMTDWPGWERISKLRALASGGSIQRGKG